MFWIDKSDNEKRSKGHKIVEDFLLTAWDEQSGKYVNCTYASFKRDGSMEKLLHQEQKGFCCYCMRHLSIGVNTSIEHVIPHNCKTRSGEIDTETINYYKQFSDNYSEVEYKHFGGCEKKWCSGMPYPHFCAYENLVLSCDGSLFTQEDKNRGKYRSQISLCCNHRRGNKRIIPLFFLPEISHLIIYTKDGRIIYSKDIEPIVGLEEFDNTLRHLGLEHDRLRYIRQALYLIATDKRYDLNDIKAAVTDVSLRMNIMADCEMPLSLVKHIKDGLYWQLLSEYYWFLDYYDNNH